MLVPPSRLIVCTLTALTFAACDVDDGSDFDDLELRDGDPFEPLDPPSPFPYPLEPKPFPGLPPTAPPDFPGPQVGDEPPMAMAPEDWAAYTVPEDLDCNVWYEQRFAMHATVTSPLLEGTKTAARNKARNSWLVRSGAWKEAIECPDSCSTPTFDDDETELAMVDCSPAEGQFIQHRCTAGHSGTVYAACGEPEGEHGSHEDPPTGQVAGPEPENLPVSDEEPSHQFLCSLDSKYLTAEGRGVGYWWSLARTEALTSAAASWDAAADGFVDATQCTGVCKVKRSWRKDVSYPAGGDESCAQYTAGETTIYDCGAATAGTQVVACFLL